jgi:hypothetical protein
VGWSMILGSYRQKRPTSPECSVGLIYDPRELSKVTTGRPGVAEVLLWSSRK